jgi:2-oxo-3-hexenedioate decarboxylase
MIDGKRAKMDKSTAYRIAVELMTAKKNCETISTPTKRYADFDLHAGYLVGAELHGILRDKSYEPVGRKIGFTNKDTWREFKLKTPIWSYMYDKTVLYSVDGKSEVCLRGMMAPRIEPEVVLKLTNEISIDSLTSEKVLNAVEWIALGFEIVDCHYPHWKFTAADAVADFGFHTNLVIGPHIPVKERDMHILEEQLRTFQVRLLRENTLVAEGIGANALGSPLLALKHLAELLDNQPWAESLSSGEIITTGTLTKLPAIRPDESWHVEINGIKLSPLSVFFTP